MHFIVKVFPEIIIKSPPVRKRLIKRLRDNLRRLLKPLSGQVEVRRDWEKIEVLGPDTDPELVRQVADVLAHTPGVDAYAWVASYPLGDLDEILERALTHWNGELDGKSFCVRVKRSGQHEFSSGEVERFVGAGLLKHNPTARVNLTRPQVKVRMEIKRRRLFMVLRQEPGLGGYPLGAQGQVLSLVSGGFDSTVASYLTMKRGLSTHFCFFNLGGRAHETAVKEIAYFLWQKYGASQTVRFVTVPFEGVVAEILEQVDNAYMGVVLKRMMLRAASRLAETMDMEALVSGESVAQVSSQTLPNLSVIDRVTDTMVLRPLITLDKRDIIQLSRDIGTETFSANVPEYCGVISVKPTTAARLHRVEAQEAKFNFDLLDQALAQREVCAVQDLAEKFEAEAQLSNETQVPIETQLPGGARVIDIRHPDEIELRPLALQEAEQVQIPFYKLNREFAQLDSGVYYLLYCGKGIMSQLHAAHLKDAGYSNVGVYRPE